MLSRDKNYFEMGMLLGTLSGVGTLFGTGGLFRTGMLFGMAIPFPSPLKETGRSVWAYHTDLP